MIIDFLKIYLFCESKMINFSSQLRSLKLEQVCISHTVYESTIA